jgi:hypothetical protein
VLAQMQQRMKPDLDDELMDKWKAARESIMCEAQHVKELAQVNFFVPFLHSVLAFASTFARTGRVQNT